MNTEFRHHRAWGLSRAEFARLHDDDAYGSHSDCQDTEERLAPSTAWTWFGMGFGVVAVALLAFLYVRGV